MASPDTTRITSSNIAWLLVTADTAPNTAAILLGYPFTDRPH
jgi:hypothetical protein